MKVKPHLIPYGRQEVDEQDVASVVNILKSDWLTQGPKVQEFEDKLVNYLNVHYAVAVNSATSALHIACKALGLSTGDWLWTSPISFVASANCGLYCDAKVDFIDIDPQTWNIDIVELERKLALSQARKTLPKILVVVHFAGVLCDMREISKLSKKYKFRIIEDASHALGGRYMDRPVGCCEYSDITVFSFHPVKIITTGEGGVATTNDQELARHMSLIRSHGVTRQEKEFVGESDGSWYYEQVELGYNYRMNDIEAALGIGQLDRLDRYVERRNEIATIYDESFSGLPIQKQAYAESTLLGRHLYVVRLKKDRLINSKGEIIKTLSQRGITATVHYRPIHLQPLYQRLGFARGDFPEAEQYYKEAITLPLFPQLTAEEIKTITTTFSNILQ